MGSVHLKLESLISTILDVVVIKTGLVISEGRLIQILNEEFPEDQTFQNYPERKEFGLRLRSENFDKYCWKVRQKLGELENDIRPYLVGDVDRAMEWYKKGYDPTKVMSRIIEVMGENYHPENPHLIDPKPVLDKVIAENNAPIELIREMFESILAMQKVSNSISPVEQILWDGGIDLIHFFEKELKPKKPTEFIEQKFINYFEANPEKLEFMHWRNFERLTAEFFKREGYAVELGPGSNDGGIDIRVYDKENDEKPYIIVQCKRHKESNQVKIETVKSFYTDVEFEEAKKGLIATTSRIAPGGKKVASIRKYPLEFAENQKIKDWVNKMKKR
ncbi:restriction endonuclease [Allomuricauda sp. R78024]|uniref:restriction endonuclease n=1 Tax=Allomuricauda sp. R78024 TaxID=3093867 RepID=UPI0037C4FC12